MNKYKIAALFFVSSLKEKSMRKFFLESAEEKIKRDTALCSYSNCGIPNDKTIKALEDSKNGIGLIECDDLEDFFKQIGLR